MKKCPKCQLIYDDNLSFCLQDGTSLIMEFEDNSSAEAETQVRANPFSNEEPDPTVFVDVNNDPTIASSIPPPIQPPISNANATPPPKKNTVNFLLLALLFLALGVIGGGGLVLFMGGLSGDQAAKNDVSPTFEPIKKKEETKKEETVEDTPEIEAEEEPTEDDLDDEIFDELLETPTPEQKTCYLSNGSGGEVNVRRNCDSSDCSTNKYTIAGTYSNGTPLTRLGQTVRSGNFTWTKISIKGGVYWVAASKIRCS